MALMAWGENIQIFMELGFPTQVFTLDSATDGVLDSDFLDGTLVGEDVSQYAQEVSISRGRSDQLQNFNAGTFSVRLLNRDRRFDPINQSSPYWNSTLGVSGVAPRRKVKVFSGGVALFTGRITDIDVSYEPNQPSATSENSYVTITASDDFVLLANTYTSSAITPTEVLSGSRVTEILDLPEVNYPATRNIDAGSAALGGGATFDIPANTNVLTYLQEVGTSEQGYFFVAANGDLTFTDRITSAFSAPVAYFSDAGTNIPYTSLSVMYGQEFLYNKVVCQVEGGTDQIANDVASQTEYGISTLNLSGLLLVDDAAASTLASELLDRYKLPEYRFDKLQTVYNRLGAVDQATLTAVDIGDVVSITRTYPTGTPATVTKEYSIENIRHVITPSSHTVEFGLAVADIVFPFILAGFPVATVSRTNLATNPSFETNTAGWTFIGGSATVSQSSTFAYAGTYSARTETTAAGSLFSVAQTNISVTAGQDYTFSAYVRSSVARDCRIFIQWYNGGTFLSNSPNTLVTSSTSSWTRLVSTGTAPATATVGYLAVRTESSVIGDLVYWDAFLVETGSTLLPYFDGVYVDAYTGYGLDNKGWNGTANASSSTTSWFVGNSRTNLVLNPSFEVDTTNWQAQLTTFTRVAGTFGSGSWVGQCVATSAGVAGATAESITVSAGTTLTASATVLRTVGTRSYQLYFNWFNGATYISTTTGTANACATPTRLSVTGTAPATTTRCRVYVASSTNATIGDTFQVDSVLCEQSSSVLPYFDGTYVDTYAGFGLYSKAWNGTANASTSTANWFVGQSRTNLVPNPNFETNILFSQCTTDGFITRSTTQSYVGSASLAGTSLSGASTVLIFGTSRDTVSERIPCTVGQTYTGSLYVKSATTSSNAFARLVFYNAAGIQVQTSNGTASPTSTTAWERRSVTATAPANATFVLFDCRFPVSGVETHYIDALLLEQGSTLLPYFDGTYADQYTGNTLIQQAWNGTANGSTSTGSWCLNTAYVGTPMDSDYALS